MTAVAVEITTGPRAEEEPARVLLVDDLETLTEDSTPGCNDDNPYQ